MQGVQIIKGGAESKKKERGLKKYMGRPN